MDSSDLFALITKLVVTAALFFCIGVSVGSTAGQISARYETLKDVQDDGLEFTVKVWNKQHRDAPILLQGK